MPDTFNIQIQGLKQLQDSLNIDKLTEKIDYELEKGIRKIEGRAKQLAPTDMGYLTGSISVNSQKLNKELTVNVGYAAFIEFGTGKYAAQYVASLPEDWRTFAATFKGQKGNGTFMDMLLHILEWVKRKGISGRYSVKTRSRLGNKSQKDAEDYETAYLIARKILKDGIRPQPFLYPAFNEIQPQILADVQKAIDTFAV